MSKVRQLCQVDHVSRVSEVKQAFGSGRGRRLKEIK